MFSSCTAINQGAGYCIAGIPLVWDRSSAPGTQVSKCLLWGMVAFIVLPLKPAWHVPCRGKCRCRYLQFAEVQYCHSPLSHVQLLLPVKHKTSEVSSHFRYSQNTTVVGRRQGFQHKSFRQESFSTWKRRLCLRIVYMVVFILACSVQVISRSQSSNFLCFGTKIS